MPTLDFKGKQYIYSHHHSVPFRELLVNEKKSLPASGKKPSLDDNLIIHGDNLHALKALMPQYAGKIKCIYIDPPYNTGNEGWCYNDNVNSPLMKEWISKNANPVDKEDMQRHDKWLCMMYPRLKLLHELLADDGVIFVSIDDNEQHNLRAVMDEIWGEQNFINNVIWQKKYAASNDAKYFSDNHDFIICFAKNRDAWVRHLLPRTEKQDSLYKYDSNDGKGLWRSDNLTVKTYSTEYDYEIKNPLTDKLYSPTNGRCWLTNKVTMQKWIDDGRVFFGQKGDGAPQLKRYLNEVQNGTVPLTLWTHEEVGHTDSSRKELKEIFCGDSIVFPTPKPTTLISRILEIATDKNSIILDSFAGSGTTAHAVLALNKKDDGNRKFILVEMEDYADSITAERLRRVIQGYKFTGIDRQKLLNEKINFSQLKNSDELLKKVELIEFQQADKFDKIKKTIKNGELIVTGETKVTDKKSGLGGSFTFCDLGNEISIEKIITGESLPDYAALAKYVFYTATGKSLDGQAKEKLDFFVAETDLYEVYLIYKPDIAFLRSNESALNDIKLKAIAARNSKKEKLVFATAKYRGQQELSSQNITFCQLPYAIHKVVGA